MGVVLRFALLASGRRQPGALSKEWNGRDHPWCGENEIRGPAHSEESYVLDMALADDRRSAEDRAVEVCVQGRGATNFHQAARVWAADQGEPVSWLE